MDKTYTISEIGRLLSLGNDAIRFYEKKGLVHPKVNSENRYRYYTLDNMLELLDIIYYRHLDLSISDIVSLNETKDPQVVMELLREKEEKTLWRIRYEQQLLKKVNYIRYAYEIAEKNENCCSIRNFPESMVLFESENQESFFIHDIQQMTQEQFVLCAFHDLYRLHDDQIKRERTFVTMETSIIDELDMKFYSENRRILPAMKCIYLCVALEKGDLTNEWIRRMQEYARSVGFRFRDEFYVREIPLTFYRDHAHYYAEIFLPILD